MMVVASTVATSIIRTRGFLAGSKAVSPGGRVVPFVICLEEWSSRAFEQALSCSRVGHAVRITPVSRPFKPAGQLFVLDPHELCCVEGAAAPVGVVGGAQVGNAGYPVRPIVGRVGGFGNVDDGSVADLLHRGPGAALARLVLGVCSFDWADFWVIDLAWVEIDLDALSAAQAGPPKCTTGMTWKQFNEGAAQGSCPTAPHRRARPSAGPVFSVLSPGRTARRSSNAMPPWRARFQGSCSLGPAQGGEKSVRERQCVAGRAT